MLCINGHCSTSVFASVSACAGVHTPQCMMGQRTTIWNWDHTQMVWPACSGLSSTSVDFFLEGGVCFCFCFLFLRRFLWVALAVYLLCRSGWPQCLSVFMPTKRPLSGTCSFQNYMAETEETSIELIPLFLLSSKDMVGFGPFSVLVPPCAAPSWPPPECSSLSKEQGHLRDQCLFRGNLT